MEMGRGGDEQWRTAIQVKIFYVRAHPRRDMMATFLGMLSVSELEKERRSVRLKPVFRIGNHLIWIRIQNFRRSHSPAYSQQQSRSSPKKGYDSDGF
jgi:hypothetical protein